MYRAGSISGSRNHPSNLVGNRNKNKRGRLAEDFFFLFDIKTKKKQRWKRKERSARQKKEENGWHFSDINRKAREIPITEYFRVPLFLRPFNQRPSKRSGLFIYTPRYVFWCIGTSDEPQKASLSLSLSLASYADGTRARTLTAQQDDLTVTRWIRKGLNVYILCTKREKRWVDQTKRRTISSGYRAIGWTAEKYLRSRSRRRHQSDRIARFHWRIETRRVSGLARWQTSDRPLNFSFLGGINSAHLVWWSSSSSVLAVHQKEKK